jgi:hypothetical protein
MQGGYGRGGKREKSGKIQKKEGMILSFRVLSKNKRKKNKIRDTGRIGQGFGPQRGLGREKICNS